MSLFIQLLAYNIGESYWKKAFLITCVEEKLYKEREPIASGYCGIDNSVSSIIFFLPC